MTYPVFIVGYMYSGKSTLGRKLAQYLNERHGVDTEFIDTDQAVEQRYHLTVTDCFHRYGEPMFRSLETTVLKQLVGNGQQKTRQSGNQALKHSGIQALMYPNTQAFKHSSIQALTIVSTGGGTPCFNDNMQWMNEHGLTIYLKLSEEGILRRMSVSRKSRPLLATMPPEQRIEYVHNQILQRQPL